MKLLTFGRLMASTKDPPPSTRLSEQDTHPRFRGLEAEEEREHDSVPVDGGGDAGVPRLRKQSVRIRLAPPRLGVDPDLDQAAPRAVRLLQEHLALVDHALDAEEREECPL